MRGLLVALLSLLAACDARAPGTGDARESTVESSPAARLLADSAAADAEALASLPPRLVGEFGVLALLSPDSLRDTTRAVCEPLGAPSGTEERRRLRATLADSSHVVLFARADRGTGTIGRVELVRRPRGAGQRGFIWDAEGDEVQALEWPVRGGRLGRPEVIVLPRGGPAPRALRALGRRLLVLPCLESRRRLGGTGS